ncbi:MAG: hypothetical protein MI749_04030 [Desulfovibrionales bacterium]|nr:hypothetical protein [Desulfovibrionales bacterium]
MKILEANHQMFGLGGFDKAQHTKDRVDVQEGALTAGKSWQGKMVSALETLGVFKDYCSGFRNHEAATNIQAAWELFGGLKEKYGEDTVDAALESTKDRFKGMDIVRQSRGITPGGGAQPSVLTCGEVRSLMDESAAIAKFQELHPKPKTAEMGTQTDAPKIQVMEVQTDPIEGVPSLQELLHPEQKSTASSKHTATTGSQASETGAASQASVQEAKQPASSKVVLQQNLPPRKNEHVTNTIANHTLAKDFVHDRTKLNDLLQSLGGKPEDLTKSHVEYVTSRVLYDVSQLATDATLTEADVKNFVADALNDSTAKSANWNRLEAIKIGVEKRRHNADSHFKADIKVLANEVQANAKQTITPEFVKQVAEQQNITLNKHQLKYTVDESIARAVRAARSQGEEIDSDDFKDIVNIVAAEAEGKSWARLFTGF